MQANPQLVVGADIPQILVIPERKEVSLVDIDMCYVQCGLRCTVSGVRYQGYMPSVIFQCSSHLDHETQRHVLDTQTGQRLRLLLPRTDEGVGLKVFQRPAPQRGCRGDSLRKETSSRDIALL